jgi:hypothetical protein
MTELKAKKTELKAKKNAVIRTAILFAFSVFVLLGAAAPAGASSVGLWWYSTLYYVTAPGETSNLTVSQTPDSFVLADSSAAITPQNGCTATDVHHAVCASKYVRYVYIKTGDANDTIAFQPTQIPATIDCGAGTDTLVTPDPNAKPVNCEYVNPPVATPEPPAPLSIVQPVATMTKRGKVPLTVSCSAAATTACIGTLTFELPAQPKKGRAGASRRGAPNILGHQKLTVQKGKRRRVRIAMTGRGRSMVKRRRKLRVIAQLTVTEGGKTHVSTQSLTIKAPPHQ